MMSRALIALVAVLALAGCGGESSSAASNEPNAKVFHVDVDGRKIACIAIDPPGESISMSCDWGGQR